MLQLICRYDVWYSTCKALSNDYYYYYYLLFLLLFDEIKGLRLVVALMASPCDAKLNDVFKSNMHSKNHFDIIIKTSQALGLSSLNFMFNVFVHIPYSTRYFYASDCLSISAETANF